MRTSTDEELRILPPSSIAKTRMVVDSVVVSSAAFTEWMYGHISALRRVGTIGLAGAIALGAVTMIRRYAWGTRVWERR